MLEVVFVFLLTRGYGQSVDDVAVGSMVHFNQAVPSGL